MIFCEKCDDICEECFEDYCCLCRLEDPTLRVRNRDKPYVLETCPDCFPKVLEYMKKFSLRLPLDKFLVELTIKERL